jgi:hypothetical protein
LCKVLIEKPFDKKYFSLIAISYAKRIMFENLALHMNDMLQRPNLVGLVPQS